MSEPLDSTPQHIGRRWLRSLCVLAALAGACHSKSPAPASGEVPEQPSAPDRLSGDERLPESETAFGLTLPAGMHLQRHFNDSAYFLGALSLPSVLAELRPHLGPSNVEMLGGRAVFKRTQIKTGSSERWVQIEVSSEANGTQVYIRDITPPPAPRGLSESELWSRVGRNPDGTPKDENQQY